MTPRIFALWAMLLFPALLAAQGMGPTPVRVDPLRMEELQARQMVTGEVKAARHSLVATQEPGLVTLLAVREGQKVPKGEVLARLDADRLHLELDSMKAEEDAARATLQERRADEEQKKRDLDTLRDLASRHAANPKEVADSESAWKIATARVSEAEKQVATFQARAALLAKRIDDTTIKAPFAGVIVARHTEVGQWIGAGDPIAELISTSGFEAWLNVPQHLIGALPHLADPIRVAIDGTGATCERKDYRLVSDVDPKARTFSVIVTLPDEFDLAPGMSVTAWVPTSSKEKHFTVSKDAILRRDAGPYLYLALGKESGPKTAMPVPVEVLFAVADRVAIQGARLFPGALAIVEGNERIMPMTPVSPILEDGGAPAKKNPMENDAQKASNGSGAAAKGENR